MNEEKMTHKNETEKVKEKKEETYSYKGWMISDSLFKRSVGVFGHNLLGALIVQIIFFLVLFVIFAVAFGLFRMI